MQRSKDSKGKEKGTMALTVEGDLDGIVLEHSPGKDSEQKPEKEGAYQKEIGGDDRG